MKHIKAWAPINIALIKYWGKQPGGSIRPTTTSLSLTLTDLFTETTIEEGTFSFELNQRQGTEKESLRVKEVLKHFRDDQVKIRSVNNFPTASGLASSASGFAALTVGLNAFFDAKYSLQELARLSRIGSGSSCRSLVDGFAIWETSGTLHHLDNPFSSLMMMVIIISDQPKTISSRDAMKLTQETAPSYPVWIQESEQDFLAMKEAIQQKNFQHVGTIMETNSHRLHKVMANANPPIVYQEKASLEIIELVKEARQQGLIGYTTMDAGANVKILFRKEDQSAWETYIQSRVSHRYMMTRIGGFAHV